MQSGGPAISDQHRLIPKSLLASKDVELFFDHLDRSCASPTAEHSPCSREADDKLNTNVDHRGKAKYKVKSNPDHLHCAEDKTDGGRKTEDNNSTGEKDTESQLSVTRDISEKQRSFPIENYCLSNASHCLDSFEASSYCRNDHSSSSSDYSGDTSPLSTSEQQLQQPVANMYQGGIALTPSAGGYGQDSMTNGYLHSGKINYVAFVLCKDILWLLS